MRFADDDDRPQQLFERTKLIHTILVAARELGSTIPQMAPEVAHLVRLVNLAESYQTQQVEDVGKAFATAAEPLLMAVR